jgi:hypothetical protein
MEIQGKATGGTAVARLILFLCPIVLHINRIELSGGKETMFKTMFFFSVQVCLDPWTVLRQLDFQRYLFLGGKGMFLWFLVKQIVPVDTA